VPADTEAEKEPVNLKSKKRRQSSADKNHSITVESYMPPKTSPYPTRQENVNKIRFTPTQGELIHTNLIVFFN
jgi:hypothetical protein